MLISFETILRKYRFKPTGVFHCGGNDGQERFDYFNAGVERVVWIEAIPDVFGRLVRNISEFPLNVAFNECVGDEDGKEVKFNVSSNRGESSSFLEFGTHAVVHPDVKYTSSFQTKTKRIDTLLKEKKIDLSNYDFLNMDLQGAELLALKGMGGELHKIKYAYLEINKAELYKGCALVGEIDTYMNGFGFKRVETSWAGNTNWGDGLYIKK